VGHSFGGVVALELAGRSPERVRAVVAWEPPYVPLAPEPDRAQLERVATLVARTHASRGPAGAARAFMDVVSPGAWDRLRPAQQEALGREGDGVLADAAMTGLDPAILDAIRAPVVLGTGGASEPFYDPIARAIAERIPGARVDVLPDLRHHAPILSAGPVAALIRPLLVLRPPHQERIP
jgi:pimeloyl-ACP methyl ester carboxylesterase